MSNNYSIFPETLIPTPYMTPGQAAPGVQVVFNGTSPYDFEGVNLPTGYEPSAAETAGLVVGTTYTIEYVFTGNGNGAISLVETSTVPADKSGNSTKRPIFDMLMFTVAA